jgi:hypothetical protein
MYWRFTPNLAPNYTWHSIPLRPVLIAYSIHVRVFEMGAFLQDLQLKFSWNSLHSHASHVYILFGSGVARSGPESSYLSLPPVTSELWWVTLMSCHPITWLLPLPALERKVFLLSNLPGEVVCCLLPACELGQEILFGLRCSKLCFGSSPADEGKAAAAACHTHTPILQLNIIIFREVFTLWSSPLCCFSRLHLLYPS